MRAIFCLDEGPFEWIYGEDLLSEIGSMVEVVCPPLSAEALRNNPKILKGIDLVFSGWGGPVFDEILLGYADCLKAVFYGAGTIKYMVSDAFWARGIQVTSAYAGNAVPVTEYALAQILIGLRGAWQQALRTRAEKTFVRLPVAGAYGSTVGLVSLGMIGKMIVKRLKTFEVKIIAYDPYVPDYPGVEMVPLERVFEDADVVSIHTPWLKETEGLIGGALIERMKPYATLINTARGAVIKENEMIEVLMRRDDLTAVLDVTYPEPPEPDSPLYTLSNVILTPHIAGSIGPECRRMGRIMVDELKRFLAGKELKYGLSREQVAIMA